MNPDRDLLFGVLAVQLGFASPQQVMACAAAWATDRSRGLAERLEADGIVSGDRRRILEGLTAEAVDLHGGDVQKSLASFGGEQAIYNSFGGSMQVSVDGGVSPGEVSDDSSEEDMVSVTTEQPGRYVFDFSNTEVGDAPATVSEIGRGGIGRVLLAYDQHLGREVAVKELLADSAGSAGSTPTAGETPVDRTSAMVARFLREARVTGQLEHPNIVPVYEVGQRMDGRLYYTMKIVRGRTLAEALKECGCLEDRLKLLNHFVDLCQAIAYAHSRGVVHRDIKPDNVMLGEFGETVVLDWGLAKIKGKKDIRGREMKREVQLYQDAAAGKTVDGHAIGTPAYMSPEQAEGEIDEIDERSDVWGLGAVLYEILTGQTPFTGVNLFEIIGKVIKDKVSPVQNICDAAPAELVTVVTKSLRKNKSKRYQSAKELAEDVEAFQSGGRVGAHEYTSFELLKRFALRNKALSATGLVSIALLIISTVMIFQAYHKAEQARDAAELARAEAVLNESKAHRNFALSLDEKAAKEMEEKAFLSARVFAAQSLLHNPFNPFSPYRFRDRDLLNTNEAAAERAMSHAPLYQAKAEGLVSYSGVLKGHEDFVTTVDFSPDGRFIASAGGDNTIRIYTFDERRVIATLKGHSKQIRKISFSPDGIFLASASSDQTLKFWQTHDWKCVATLTGHNGAIPSLAFSPKGRLVATGGFDGTVRIWDVSKRRLLRILKGHEDRVWSVTFSPDGKTLASAGKDSKIRLWSVASFQLVKVLSGHEDQVLSVSFSPDGKMLASTGWNKMVLVWNLPEFEVAATLRGHKDRVLASAFSTDSKILATSSFDSEIKLWTTDDLKLTETVKGHSSAVWSLSFSPDGKTMASSSSDKTIKLWSIAEDRMSRTLKGHTERVYSIALSPDGKTLASASWDQSVRLWNMESGEQLYEFKGHTGQLTAVEFSPSGDEVASVGYDKTIRLWSVEKKKEKRVITGHTEAIWTIAYSPDGKLLASAGKDKTIRLWNLSDGSEAAILEGNEGLVFSVVFSPDGLLLASAGADKTVRLWSVEKGVQLKLASDHEDWVSGLAFSPDGLTLASSGKDGKIILREVPSLIQRMTISGHESWVNAVVFSPDGRLLLSGSDDNSARIWNAKTGDLLQIVSLSAGVSCPVFSRDNRYFIVDNMENIIIYPLALGIWRRPPDEIVREVEGESGLRLEGLNLTPID